MKIVNWIDGKKYKNVDEGLTKFFNSENSDGTNTLNSVGIVIYRGIINSFLPKNTVSDYVGPSELSTLLNVLIKYKNKVSYTGQENIVESSDLFIIIKWIINDFKVNGIFFNNVKMTKKQNSGKIDWNYTIKKVVPIVLHDDLVITDFYKKKSFLNTDVLTIAQIMILEDISQKYGFLFKFKYKSSIKLRLKNRFSLNIIESELKSKLKYTNGIRDRQLIKQIIAYIEQSGDSNQLSIVTNEFHVIFEDAVKKFFNHSEYLKNYVPKAFWNIDIGDETFCPVNRQIPDALVVINKQLNIYDAKYYNFNEFTLNNNYPPLDWYSVGKQFFYCLSFDYKKSELKRGENNFVFPCFPINSAYSNVGSVTIIINNEEEKINLLKINTFNILNYLN